MSAAEQSREEAHADPLDGVRLLQLGERVKYELIDGATLELRSRDSVASPLGVAVRADGETFADTTARTRFFDHGGTDREQFATEAARLVALHTGADESTVVDAIDDALDAIRERLVNGTLQAVDRPTADLLAATESVHYDPKAAEWTVVFEGEGVNPTEMEYLRPHFTVDASTWATSDASPTPTWPGLRATSSHIRGDQPPEPVFDDDQGSRWRAARTVWTRAATTGSPELTIPVTEEAIRERGTLPGQDMTVEEFEEAVAEADTFENTGGETGLRSKVPLQVNDMKRFIRVLGLEDELADFSDRFGDSEK